MYEGTIDPSDLDLSVLVNESFSPAARSAAIADFARETLADAEAQNKEALGFVPDHTTTVDGALGAKEDAVRPDGQIVYTFALLDELFVWILEQLETFAPVRTGAFKASFELYADRQKIDPRGIIPPAKEYEFVSSSAYAAQLEGYPGRPPESKQAPDGVFEAVAVLAQQRFGNQTEIVFWYRPPLSGELLTVLNARSARDRKTRTSANRTFVLTPSILITPRS